MNLMIVSMLCIVLLSFLFLWQGFDGPMLAFAGSIVSNMILVSLIGMTYDIELFTNKFVVPVVAIIMFIFSVFIKIFIDKQTLKSKKMINNKKTL